MRKLHVVLIAAVAAVSTPMAYADEGDDLDGVEMEVMDEGATPNANSTKILALPEEASDAAREHAQRGLDTANSAREDGAAFGEAAAQAAREGHGKPEDPGRP